MSYKIYQNKKKKWIVRHEDGKKNMGEFDTQIDAIDFVTKLAKKCKVKANVQVT